MRMPRAAGSDRLVDVAIDCTATIAEAIARLERAGTGALILCDEDRILRGLLTDGDVRRAILRDVSFDWPCKIIANDNPVVALEGCSGAEAIHLMDHGREFVLNHLPVVDRSGRIVDLLLRSDLVSEERLGISAVIMAGGFGTRMRPLTDHLPKPMLPLGDRPVLEHTIERLRDAGIQR